MEQNNNDTQYEDAEAFSYSFNKDKLNFKDIILLHLKKIGDYVSVEFRGGFWESREIPAGNYGTITHKTYIPDSREVYSNAVGYLADTLYPYFDKEMMEAFQKSEKEEKEAFLDTTIIKEPDREDQNPKEAERHFKTVERRRSFRTERVKISRRLFRALSCFLYRQKYLEMGTISD